MKIIESYKVKDKFMKTPIGDIEILFVHKTIKYDIFEIILENGLKLQGSGEHSVITSKGFEIKLKHSLGVELATIYGESKVISIKFIKHDHCFDVTLKDFHLYYTNGILSHNSGKSVTSGLYLLWKSLFTENINIGIAANKLSLAMEVLDKIKKIFIELPIWLQQGITAWNKTFIEFENGTRIMTSATNSDAFRGFSCLEKNEILDLYDTIDGEEKRLSIKELYDTCVDSPYMKLNFRYKIKTPRGYRNFKGVLKSTHSEGFKVTLDNGVSFIATSTHRIKVSNRIFRTISNIKIKNKISRYKVISKEKVSNTEFYDLFDVEETHSYLHKGLIHHNCHLIFVDEVAFIPTNTWNELTDSLFPAQDALAQKQKILCSTPNGTNHWYHLVTGARNGTNGYRFFTSDWKQVPRYNKDGSVKDIEEFKDEIIRKNGKQFFAQNYALEFLGSSSTLVSSEALKNFVALDDNLVIYDSLFCGLRIFEEPISTHSYVIGVDPKKEGVDRLAIQVIDVTSLPFKQVASYNTDLSYLTAPSRLFDLGTYYNNAYIIVENNIDNSIVDTLFYQYDYEGEIYKEDGKNILGFRTTVKTKKILLSLLKKLIEEGKLIINDKKTIDEFFVFVEKKNGSFSAEDGYHDDLVMALMVALAPFINIRQFDDFKGFIEFVEKKRIEQEEEAEEFAKFFSGTSFSTVISDDDIESLNKEILSFDY